MFSTDSGELKKRILIIFILTIAITSLGWAQISVYPEKIEVFPDDSFKINVSFECESNEEIVFTAIHDKTLELLSPVSEINFGKGSISGMLVYNFRALESGESVITFEVPGLDDCKSETEVTIKQRYVDLKVPSEIIVWEGNPFELSMEFDVMNSKNVSVFFEYNEEIFETNADSLFIGSGSFSKEVKTRFLTAEPINTGKEEIIITTCSETDCISREVTLILKAVSFEIFPESLLIGPGEEINFLVETRIFNTKPEFSLDYDSEWFEMEILLDVLEGENSIEGVIRMKEKAEGCPNSNIIFKLNDSEQHIILELKPMFYLDIDSNPTFSRESELTLFYSIKSFGYETPEAAIIYPKDFSHGEKETRGKLDDLELVLNPFFSDFKTITFKDNFCLNEQGSITFKTDSADKESYNLRILGLDAGLVVLEENISIFRTEIKADSFETIVPLDGLKACPRGFELDRSRRVCFPILPVVVCPPGSDYNPETERCEIYPEVEIICPVGNYNPDSDKCEHYPEVQFICEDGEIMNKKTFEVLEVINVENISPGDEFGNFIVYKTEYFTNNKPIEVSVNYVFENSVSGNIEVSLYNEDMVLIDSESAYVSKINYEINDNSGNVHGDLIINRLNEDEINLTFYRIPFLQKNNYVLKIAITEPICFWNPPESPVCEVGEYDYDSQTCVYTPETTISCSLGDYNPEKNICEFYPDEEFICGEGIYDEETGYCAIHPEQSIECETGEYNENTGFCEINPQTEYVCEDGEYDSARQACVIRVTSTRTISSVREVCEEGEFIEEEEICVIYPDVLSVCPKGDFDSATGLCLYEAEIEYLCSYGTYDASLNSCVVSPPETDSIFDIYSRTGELVALSFEILNTRQTPMENMSLVLATGSEYELINYKLGTTSISPGESAMGTYIIKFHDAGEHSVRLVLKEGNETVNFKRFNVIVEPSSFLTGRFIGENTFSMTALGLLSALAILGGSFYLKDKFTKK